ncbi:uncharacterized protein UV8b_07697 [Ustilaginoidea virens]|uniref:Uncharacterized protein n=1 Tax=Ustilaginoidea virens TaxID=1159556 RepID=A0A8E5HXP2_USTVR|nr:uncharacterized protein UV8b_07697 [Ustilaginoidea virens]QUC23456.1 hypothetical protein UV8b_07697 [Ustilaginoidea virens]
MPGCAGNDRSASQRTCALASSIAITPPGFLARSRARRFRSAKESKPDKSKRLIVNRVRHASLDIEGAAGDPADDPENVYPLQPVGVHISRLPGPLNVRSSSINQR